MDPEYAKTHPLGIQNTPKAKAIMAGFKIIHITLEDFDTK